MAAARRDQTTGLWEDAYLSRRSDTAIVRSLRDGRRSVVAIRILILHEEEGLRRDPATYPDLPRWHSTNALPHRNWQALSKVANEDSERVPLRWFRSQYGVP